MSAVPVKGRTFRAEAEKELEIRMHKAISVIQFKVEGETIKRNPSFHLEKEIFCI